MNWRISADMPCSAFGSKKSGFLPDASQSEAWMWLDEPASEKSHFAMKVTALPRPKAISFTPFFRIEWRSAISSASA